MFNKLTLSTIAFAGLAVAAPILERDLSNGTSVSASNCMGCVVLGACYATAESVRNVLNDPQACEGLGGVELKAGLTKCLDSDIFSMAQSGASPLGDVSDALEDDASRVAQNVSVPSGPSPDAQSAQSNTQSPHRKINLGPLRLSSVGNETQTAEQDVQQSADEEANGAAGPMQGTQSASAESAGDDDAEFMMDQPENYFDDGASEVEDTLKAAGQNIEDQANDIQDAANETTKKDDDRTTTSANQADNQTTLSKQVDNKTSEYLKNLEDKSRQEGEMAQGQSADGANVDEAVDLGCSCSDSS